MDLIDRETTLKALCYDCVNRHHCKAKPGRKCSERLLLENVPSIDAQPVRHGYWIECDYKHLEHGMIETEPNAGLCCSECRTAFQKKKMTYKQYCSACGVKMDGGVDDDERR